MENNLSLTVFIVRLYLFFLDVAGRDFNDDANDGQKTSTLTNEREHDKNDLNIPDVQRNDIDGPSLIAPSALWDLRRQLSQARKIKSGNGPPPIDNTPQAPVFVKGNVRAKSSDYQSLHQIKTFRKATVSDDSDAEKFIFHLENDSHQGHEDGKESFLPQKSSRSKYIVDVDDEVAAKLLDRHKPFVESRKEDVDDTELNIRANKPLPEEPKLANAPADVYKGFKPTLRKPLSDQDDETNFSEKKKERKETEVKYPSPKFPWQKEIISTKEEDDDETPPLIKDEDEKDMLANTPAVPEVKINQDNQTNNLSQNLDAANKSSVSSSENSNSSPLSPSNTPQQAQLQTGGDGTSLVNRAITVTPLGNMITTLSSVNETEPYDTPHPINQYSNSLKISEQIDKLGTNEKQTALSQSATTTAEAKSNNNVLDVNNPAVAYNANKNDNTQTIMDGSNPLLSRSELNKAGNSNISNFITPENQEKELTSPSQVASKYPQDEENFPEFSETNSPGISDEAANVEHESFSTPGNKANVNPILDNNQHTIRENGKNQQGNINSNANTIENENLNLKSEEPSNYLKSSGNINMDLKCSECVNNNMDSTYSNLNDNATASNTSSSVTRNVSSPEKVDTANYSPPKSFIDNEKVFNSELSTEKSQGIPSTNSVGQKEEENFISSAIYRRPDLLTKIDSSPIISEGLDLREKTFDNSNPSAPTLGNVLMENPIKGGESQQGVYTKSFEKESSPINYFNGHAVEQKQGNKDASNPLDLSHKKAAHSSQIANGDSDDNTFLQKMAAYDEFLKHVGNRVDDTSACSRSADPLKCENKEILKSSSVINALDKELSKISSSAINELNQELAVRSSPSDINSFSKLVDGEAKETYAINAANPLLSNVLTATSASLLSKELEKESDHSNSNLKDHFSATSALTKELAKSNQEKQAEDNPRTSSTEEFNNAFPHPFHKEEPHMEHIDSLSREEFINSVRHTRPSDIYYDMTKSEQSHDQENLSPPDKLLSAKIMNSSFSNATILEAPKLEKETFAPGIASFNPLLLHHNKSLRTMYLHERPSLPSIGLDHRLAREKATRYVFAQRQKYQLELERKKLLADKLLETRKRQREIEEAAKLSNVKHNMAETHNAFKETTALDKYPSMDILPHKNFELTENKYIKSHLLPDYNSPAIQQENKLYNRLLGNRDNNEMNSLLAHKIFAPKENAFQPELDPFDSTRINIRITNMVNNHINKLNKHIFHPNHENILLTKNPNILMPFKAPHPKGPSIVFDQFSPAATHSLLIPSNRYSINESPVSRTHILNGTRRHQKHSKHNIRARHDSPKGKTTKTSGPNYGYGSGNGYGYGTNSWGWGGGGGWAGTPPPGGIPSPGDFSPSNANGAPEIPSTSSASPQAGGNHPGVSNANSSASALDAAPAAPSDPSASSTPAAPSLPSAPSAQSPVTYNSDGNKTEVTNVNDTTTRKVEKVLPAVPKRGEEKHAKYVDYYLELYKELHLKEKFKHKNRKSHHKIQRKLKTNIGFDQDKRVSTYSKLEMKNSTTTVRTVHKKRKEHDGY